MRSNDLAMKVIDILKRIEVTYSTKNREVYRGSDVLFKLIKRANK